MKSDNWPIARWGCYALVLLYTIYYFTDLAAPGNRVEYPLGWWGWWDQSQYIASTRNLLAGNLAPQGHWYPLGYSIVAMPFVHFWPMHGFFFLDLVCLLATYASFLRFACRVRIGPPAAVSIFLLTTFAYTSIAETWAEPWTSTLSAALIWGLLACAASLMLDDWRKWRLASLGLLAGALPLVRPPDAILSAIVVLFVSLARLRVERLQIRHLGWLVLGVAVAELPYTVLYLRIYGLHATPYMSVVRDIGFVFPRLGWKTYLLLIEPRPWYPLGKGLLTPFPWLVLSFAEIVLIAFTWARGQSQAVLILLGLLIVLYWALYFAFVDLLPSGIWRFHLVHYLKWTLPGLGLFAWLFVQRIWQAPRWQHALVMAVLLIVLSVRIVPVRATPDEDAEMIQYAGPQRTWEDTYLREWGFSDAFGRLGSLGARAVPDSQGVRVLAQRRAIVGALSWSDGPIEVIAPSVRWKAHLTIGYPCWLPPYPCRWLQPRS